MILRVLIVDDEPAARARLRAQLRDAGNVEVIGECGDGLSALRVIRERAPSLVLLDVDMPGLDGFGVLEAIASEPPPRMVLMTEPDSYGFAACERHRLAHLVKPVERERLGRALAQAGASTNGGGAHGIAASSKGGANESRSNSADFAADRKSVV